MTLLLGMNHLEFLPFPSSGRDLKSALFDNIMKIYEFSQKLIRVIWRTHVLKSNKSRQYHAVTPAQSKKEGGYKNRGRSVIGGMMKETWGTAPLCLRPIETSVVIIPPFGVEGAKEGWFVVLRRSAGDVSGWIDQDAVR
ncbi:hypothetical protein BDQ17DRAFT_1331502 [Cyathus striatus]|nr:hypothetical protein BDQ17DRAFT_1331502 [Cyathus striatus]